MIAFQEVMNLTCMHQKVKIWISTKNSYLSIRLRIIQTDETNPTGNLAPIVNAGGTKAGATTVSDHHLDHQFMHQVYLYLLICHFLVPLSHKFKLLYQFLHKRNHHLFRHQFKHVFRDTNYRKTKSALWVYDC